MKIKFNQNKDGKIVVEIDNKAFVTKDYLQMIKEIKSNNKIEAEFTETISQDEQKIVNQMIEKINKIKEAEIKEDGEVNSDDIPF